MNRIDPNQNDDRVVGAAAIAAYLGITPATISVWVKVGAPGGGLEIHKAVNGRLFCYRADLEEFARRYAAVYASREAV